MRPIVIPGLLIATAVAMLAPAGSAQAARTPVMDPLGSGTPNGSITLPNNRCAFSVKIGVVTNKEFQDVTTLADGTTITKITGNLVLSFTNVETSKAIVRNVSGPTTETDHFDAQGNFTGGTFVGLGPSWFGFGPISQGNTGEPGLVFTSGLATLGLGPHGVTSFSLNGTQKNGCTLLAAP